MLMGCLAAFIPTAVHLFNRRRPKPHPFAAISFIIKGHRQSASRVRFRRFLLYLARTLILAAIPIALARPHFGPHGETTTAYGPKATMIVLDASLSMQFVKSKPLFDIGKDYARQVLKNLRSQDSAGLWLCSDVSSVGDVARTSLSFDHLKVRADIDDAKVTFAPADLGRCLDAATTELSKSPLAGKTHRRYFRLYCKKPTDGPSVARTSPRNCANERRP